MLTPEQNKPGISRNHHYNVLQHIMGYFKRDLAQEDKRELLDVFNAYRALQVPLAAPVTLLSHHLRKHPDAYLARQHYLKPYPRHAGAYQRKQARSSLQRLFGAYEQTAL